VKVLFVSSGNLNKGRPSVLVKNQGDSLVDCDIEVVYFTIQNKGLMGYLGAVRHILRTIKLKKPDCIHSHYSLSAFATSIALILLRKKIPHIVSLMGSDTKIGGWKRTLTIHFSKSRWNHTIVKAESMAKELGINKYNVIPNGVDMRKLKSISSDNNLSVIFPADPSRKSKNYNLAERAVSLVKESIPNLNFEICFGLKHAEIISKLQQSGVVLITSLWEGSPNIVKEAMVLNKPIVCTKVGDTELLLENVSGAFLVGFDVQEVANGIKKAIAFSQSESKSTGRMRIEELKLDSTSIAKRLINIYKS
jgi:teichuronic acid biosynthesis glycosyltransferase TuaC